MQERMLGEGKKRESLTMKNNDNCENINDLVDSIVNKRCSEVFNEEYELVNKPNHYLGKNGLYADDVIEAFGFGTGFRLGNAIKYIIRAGKKPGESAAQDLEKAVTYIQKHIETIKN